MIKYIMQYKGDHFRAPWRFACCCTLGAALGVAGAQQAVPQPQAPEAAASQPAAAASAPAPAEARALTADTRLAAARLREDAALLRRAFEALHPGLYRDNTPAEIDAAFAQLNKTFARDRTLAEAYLAFTQFTAQLRCGHTWPNFLNQPRSVREALFNAPRLPFEFKWIADRTAPRMIVTRSDDARLKPGAEVLALNDVLSVTVLERLLRLARADGGNDAARLRLLERSDADRHSAFDLYYALLFPWSRWDAPQAARISLVVRGPGGGAPMHLELDAAPPRPQPPMRDADAPLWDMQLDADGIALMRMPTWSVYDSRWDWKAWLAQAFAQLAERGVRDLVVDLRGNEGGLAVGDELLRHVVSEPLPVAAPLRLVRYRSVPEELRPVLDTWDAAFFDWGDAAQPYDERYFALKAGDDAGAITPAAPHFEGRLWVLVDAANRSATFQFAQRVQRNALGTLVGEPTGGNQRGINGGAFFFLRLPNSRIEIDLPLIATFAPPGAPDAGIVPDVLAPLTVDDIAQGRDAAMEAVRQRIRLARRPLALR
jgi:hypothetical protein